MFCITKCRKVILLQSATDCYFKVRQVLQSETYSSEQFLLLNVGMGAFGLKARALFFKIYNLMGNEVVGNIKYCLAK